MQKGFILPVFIAVMAVLFVVSCGNDQELPEPTGSAVEGVVLEMGHEVDEDDRIILPETTFTANEDFYFSFYNNEPFENEPIEVMLIKSETGEVLADNVYEVRPDEDTIADMIWFGKPGLYKILVEVGGEERAFQEVIIE